MNISLSPSISKIETISIKNLDRELKLKIKGKDYQTYFLEFKANKKLFIEVYPENEDDIYQKEFAIEDIQKMNDDFKKYTDIIKFFDDYISKADEQKIMIIQEEEESKHICVFLNISKTRIKNNVSFELNPIKYNLISRIDNLIRNNHDINDMQNELIKIKDEIINNYELKELAKYKQNINSIQNNSKSIKENSSYFSAKSCNFISIHEENEEDKEIEKENEEEIFLKTLNNNKFNSHGRVKGLIQKSKSFQLDSNNPVKIFGIKLLWSPIRKKKMYRLPGNKAIFSFEWLFDLAGNPSISEDETRYLLNPTRKYNKLTPAQCQLLDFSNIQIIDSDGNKIDQRNIISENLEDTTYKPIGIFDYPVLMKKYYFLYQLKNKEFPIQFDFILYDENYISYVTYNGICLKNKDAYNRSVKIIFKESKLDDIKNLNHEIINKLLNN